MIADLPTPTPIVHLASDLQTRFVRGLDAERAARFGPEIRDFADDLRARGIPTVWIAFDLDAQSAFKFYADPVTRRKKVKALGMALKLKDDEILYVKRGSGPFQEPPLAEYLRRRGTHTVIHSGIETIVCVKNAVLGAAAAGLTNLVAYDRLADPHVDLINDRDPDSHKAALCADARLAAMPRLAFTRAESLLTQLDQRPLRGSEALLGVFRPPGGMPTSALGPQACL